MDPIDEYARLKAEIRRMEDRAEVLRAGLLKPGARRRSNQYEVVVKEQVRQTFQKDLLPPELLQSPRFWKESRCQVLSLRALSVVARLEVDDLELVERFSP